MATTTEVMGEGSGGGGCAVKREIAVKRTSAGESTLRTKSGGLIATAVAANMIVSIVSRLS